jgi:hypothetical protein
MKVAIFWDIAPCSPYMNGRFGGTYLLHFQGRKAAEQEISVYKQRFIYGLHVAISQKMATLNNSFVSIKLIFVNTFAFSLQYILCFVKDCCELSITVISLLGYAVA